MHEVGLPISCFFESWELPSAQTTQWLCRLWGNHEKISVIAGFELKVQILADTSWMLCGIQNRWLLWSETPSLGHKYSLPDRFALSPRAREKDWPWSWIKKMCPDPETSQPSLKKLDNIAQNLHRSPQSFGTISSCPWCSHMWVSRSLNTHPCCPRGDGWLSPSLFATSFFFSPDWQL